MDPATIVGIILAFVIVFVATILEGGNPMAMFLVPPMLLVFVATFGAALAGGTLKDAISSIKGAIKAMTAKAPDSTETVTTIVSLAERARREGLLALEEAVKDVDDEFLRDGLQGAIDGTDPEELQDILHAKIASKKAADKSDARLFADMGGYAPTVGIIGTVLGLIHVLENLANPEQLGHLIAAAFVATLWGVMTANIIWLPMASRIKRLSEVEAARMELIAEGIHAIQSGSNPRVVAAKLESLLPPGSLEREAA
jgi:chemotaxis protein MotA